MPGPDSNIDSRVSSLETSVDSLHEDLVDVKRAMGVGFDRIQTALTSSSRTNWSVIFAGLALVGTVWAAAIRPLTADIGRIEKTEEMAAILTVKNADRNTEEKISLVSRLVYLETVERLRQEGKLK